MNSIVLDWTDQNTCYLEGSINRENVVLLLEQCEHALRHHDIICFNFEKIVECDSTAIAMCLTLLEQQQQSKCRIQFSHFPVSLHKVIKLSELESVFEEYLVSNED